MAAILSGSIDASPRSICGHSRAEKLAGANMMIDRDWVTVSECERIEGFGAHDGKSVHALYLDEAVCGTGIGCHLPADAQHHQDRPTRWAFEASASAWRIYVRRGFREVTRRAGENDEGLTDIQLCWERGAA